MKGKCNPFLLLQKSSAELQSYHCGNSGRSCLGYPGLCRTSTVKVLAGGDVLLGNLPISHVRTSGCCPVGGSWGRVAWGAKWDLFFQEITKTKYSARFSQGLCWPGRTTFVRLIAGTETLRWASLHWGHMGLLFCVPTLAWAWSQQSHSWFICAEMLAGSYPVSSAHCTWTAFFLLYMRLLWNMF